MSFFNFDSPAPPDARETFLEQKPDRKKPPSAQDYFLGKKKEEEEEKATSSRREKIESRALASYKRVDVDPAPSNIRRPLTR